MTRQITPRMQDIDDDDFVGLVQKNQKMLPCPNKPQVIGFIHEDCTAPAMRLTAQSPFTAVKQFRLVELCLAQPEILDRPAGDLGEAGFRTTRQPERSAHKRARAVAKARRIASLPLPAARSPSLACARPSRRPFRIPASCASSCSSSLRPARIASLTFW